MNPSELVDFNTISGWTLLGVVLVLLVTWLLFRLTKHTVLRLLRRIDGISEEIAAGASRIAGYFVILLGVGIALSMLGAEVQPLLAAAIVLAVVVVLALRGVADNFGASLIIQTRKPIHLGDRIATHDEVGTVVEMNARSVVIITNDGRTIHVPNGKLLSDPIVNHSVSGALRSEIEIRTSHVTHLGTVEKHVLEAVRNVTGVLDAPTPDVVWTGSSVERMTGRIRFWLDPDSGRRMTSAVVVAVAQELREAKIPATLECPPPAQPLTAPPAL
ncbi:MscS Mechanosensitive ion channel [Beutenbergia cavernae DSM 12333]|uniref:MscS Mechanosensitive ion channel n=1 Tax=Beutenbergia cavernae (strain ATCC BAA-8 / DSM 12333 / CCUG 43141 / JCM 11478 / NBRC 16432 / NCIMB 13614 / HKI 0122) TaxID=471853 RepID=C5BYQ3_BEUC1|nr:mechanosensitive ion channel domain-containing protein [Beutenbergia cavernae]ACQ79011.1 MscS Mechanosensitive ion channel [Beutenbergia cavernae DSM 12333]